MIEEVSHSADRQDRKEQCRTIELDQECENQKNAASRLYHKQKRTCQENKYNFFSPGGQQIMGINKENPQRLPLDAAGGVHRRPRMSCPQSYCGQSTKQETYQLGHFNNYILFRTVSRNFLWGLADKTVGESTHVLTECNEFKGL